MAMELSPNLGAGFAQFGTNYERVSRHFMPYIVFLCRLKLLNVIQACWIFFVLLSLLQKIIIKIPVCV